MTINQPPQTNYCSNCGHPVETGTIFCSDCGVQLDQFSDLNPNFETNRPPYIELKNPTNKKRTENPTINTHSNSLKWLFLIPMALFVVILIMIINTQKPNKPLKSINGSSLPTVQSDKPMALNTVVELQPTITAVPIDTEEMDQKQATEVKITSITEGGKNSARSTPTSSCPGAPDQRLIVGENARVCTKSDSVYVRKDPSRSSEILTSVSPSTIVKVIDGPECADNWSFWKVELSNGKSGWMAEGGDKIDPYFLCPFSSAGTGSISGHLYYPSEMIPSGYLVAINIDTNEIAYTVVKLNQFTFQIDNLQPGEYYIAFYLPYKSYPDKSTIFVNTYTKYVDCIRASSNTVPMCNDHTLIPVKVYAGQTTNDIHLLDYILTTDYGLPTNPINP